MNRAARRRLWEAELARADQVWRERFARAEQRHASTVAFLQGQIEDLRHRLAEMERAAGLADIARAPVRRDELRRFAGSRA
ncbi:MAG: hypothetical protein ACREFA_03455 [Stellaceae bacterium]